MTIDEAIKHCEEVAESQESYCNQDGFESITISHKKCAEEHRELAEWLKELKQYRETQRWIPVSERLPEENESVIASTKEYGWQRAFMDAFTRKI